MIALIALCLILGAVLYKLTKRPSGLPPGPPNLPVLGYAPFLGRKPHEKFIELGEKYGDVFSFNMGPFLRFVILNSYSAIKDAYKDDAFAGRPDTFFVHLRSDGYHGVAFNHGAHWQELRRQSLRVLRDFGFGKSVLESAIVNEITELLTTLKKESGIPMKLQGRFNLAVLNALWAITTGERVQLDDPEVNLILNHLQRVISDLTLSGLMMVIPYSKFIPPNLVGAQDFVNQLNTMKDLFQREILRQTESYCTDRQTDNLIKNFLERISETTDQTSALYKDKGMKNLLYLIMDFFVAGSQTISSTLTWMVLLLAEHPDIQEQVHAELDRVVGRNRLPSLDDKPRLPFLEAVVMETHRIASITPLGLPHSLMADTEFRGYKIPKGTVVMSNLYAVHRDPKVWKKPTEFYPEHFLDEQGQLVTNEHLLTFSTGKRVCLGESLARMELYLFTAHLLHNFKFSLPEDGVRPAFEKMQSLIGDPPPFDVLLTAR